MLIKETQIAVIAAPAKEAFIIKTIVFLRESTPVWAETKSDQEIATHIHQMIEMASDRRINKEINIQKLLYHSIAYQLELPFSKELELQLAQAVFGEDYRVKCFIRQIQKYDVR